MAFDAILWAKLKNCAILVDGKVSSDQLPSYIDDVIEVATYADLPQPGEKSKIYYVLDDKKSYRWGSQSYILVTSGNDEEIATTEQLDLKSDAVLFTTNCKVKNSIGGFKVNDSVKDLSIKDILIRLLDITDVETPDEPDSPSSPIAPDEVETLYTTQDGGKTFTEVSNIAVIADASASSKDLSGVFEDIDGNVGYQLQYNVIDEDAVAKVYIDPQYEITEVQSWDPSSSTWVTSDLEEWVWEESPSLETVTIDGSAKTMRVYTYNVDYTGGVASTEFRFVLNLIE